MNAARAGNQTHRPARPNTPNVRITEGTSGMIVSGPPPGSARQTHRTAMASVFDLTRFSVTDMVVASGELRQAAALATTMEDASRAVVSYLRSAFTDPATGRPAFALVRMFHTVTC